jgi:hypothetical protein
MLQFLPGHEFHFDVTSRFRETLHVPVACAPGGDCASFLSPIGPYVCVHRDDECLCEGFSEQQRSVASRWEAASDHIVLSDNTGQSWLVSYCVEGEVLTMTFPGPPGVTPAYLRLVRVSRD